MKHLRFWGRRAGVLIGVLMGVTVAFGASGQKAPARAKKAKVVAKAKPLANKPAVEAAPVAEGPPRIPVLNWIPRSDWIDVKQQATPPAVGDGVADDTAAIQSVLDKVTDGSVIYFPAGTYRITDTLRLKINRDPLYGPAHRVAGVAFIGHGSATTLLWDGPEGKELLLESGASYSRYNGLVFDGRGKATVGLHHFGEEGTFETEVGHRNLEFRNFTDAGILAKVLPATAEVTIENCFFEECRRGVAILNWNEYDYTIDGCEFRRCDVGVEVEHGNTYIRNSHFEGSTDVDISLNPEHGCSVRRVTSSGSRQFIRYGNPVAPISIQDCRVSGWTNPEAAIVLSGAPAVLFDTAFTNPPSEFPPVKILDVLALYNRPSQRLFISGCASEGTDGIYTNGVGVVYPVPAGKYKGSLVSASQRFLTDTAVVPPRVFDARRDFGAAGDGKTDDTAAIQKAIDAARAFGKGAIAYLPTGDYVISETLQIKGSNYVVGGSGRRSVVLWRGAETGTMLKIVDPQNVTLENIMVGNSDVGVESKNAVDIEQVSTADVPSMMTYDNVSVYGMYAKQPFRKGLWLRGLNKNATVLMSHVQGNIRVHDSARASVLLGVTYEGSITVEGKSKQRDGFLGVLTHLGTLCEYSLYVRDNHSLVASDFYMEQSNHGYSFEGSPDDPDGRITISAPKFHMQSDAEDPRRMAVLIGGYHGDINLGPVQYYINPSTMNVSHTGSEPVSIMMWASALYSVKLNVKKEAAAHVISTGSIGVSQDLEGVQVEDAASPESLQQVAVALDDLRRLGALDLKLNHPHVKVAAAK